MKKENQKVPSTPDKNANETLHEMGIRLRKKAARAVQKITGGITSGIQAGAGNQEGVAQAAARSSTQQALTRLAKDEGWFITDSPFGLARGQAHY